MFKLKLLALTLLILVSTALYGYSQEKAENRNIETLFATVESVDNVGRIITVKTGNDEVVLFVPDKVAVILGKENVGLLDLALNDPVTIKYYISSEGKNIAVSIIDNRSTSRIQ